MTKDLPEVRGPASVFRPALLLILAFAGCIDLARPDVLVDAGGGISDTIGEGGGPGSVGGFGGIDATGGTGGVDSDGPGGAGGTEGSGGGLTNPPDANEAPATGGTSGVPDAATEVPTTPVKLGLGVDCSGSTACGSGFCVDGVCCDSACAGLCRTCAAATTKGTCTPAPAGTDPRNSCPDDGAATCGRTGMCDAAQACQRYAANTVCSAATCSNGQITATSRCDQAGVCQAGAVTSCYPNACTTAATPACKFICFSKADCSGAAECFSGFCGGLLGTYFANESLTGRSVSRIDPNVDFDFHDNAPEPTMPVDMFAIRWTGKITPLTSGTYRFYVLSDDGVRLWIDNQQIIDDWRVHASEEASGQISLTAGKAVAVRLEYFDRQGSAHIRLAWSPNGGSKQVIQSNALTP